MREKLGSYSLDPDHPHGGPKASGFASILGITRTSIDYLEAEIRAAILWDPITSIRPNLPFGINCVVEFPLCGIGRYSERIATLRTVWELTSADSRPRLVNAYLRKTRA